MKKPSPAQLAARKRFAEMARSGAFKKTVKRKANPVDKYIEKFHLGGKIYAQIIEKSDGTFDYYVYQMQATGIANEGPYEQFFDSKNYKTKSGAMRGLEKWAMRHQYKVTPQLHTNPIETGMRYQIFKSNGPLDSEYKTLTQMQSALDEIDRKPSGRYYGYDKAFGKTYHSFAHNQPSAVVKNNPMHSYTVLHRGTANVAGQVTASGPQAAKQKIAEKLGIPTLAYLVAKKTNPAKKTVSQKISQLVHEGYPQRQAVAVALSEQRSGKVKRNPRPAKPKKYYQVSIMQEGLHKTFMPMALFLTFAEAENYSHHLAKQHKNWTIRVHDTRAM